MKILLLGFSKKKTSSYVTRRLANEFRKRGHVVNYMQWGGLVFSFSKLGFSIKRPNGIELKYYDYVVVRNPLLKGKESGAKYISHLYRHYLLLVGYLNTHHKHVLNEKTAKIIPFYDKLLQHYILSKAGLPIVPTLLYTGQQRPSSVYNKFKKPYILKNIEGSRGKEVFLVDSATNIEKLIEEFGKGSLLVQKYLKTNTDYRILVLGNKILGGMKRTASDGDFRANYSLGGTIEKIKTTKEMRLLTKKAAKAFNAEFAGVDLIKYKGKYYILEVNIFPGFEGFEAATGINVAKKLVEYIEKKYLWTIKYEFTSDAKKGMFEQLYKIEKGNLEKPLSKKHFLKTLLERELITINKNNTPIAYMTHYQKGSIRRITRMGILKQFRGQRMGRRMIQQLIKISKKAEDKKINAIVPATNKKRRLSFKKAGFSKLETKKGYFIDKTDGVVFEYVLKTKKKLLKKADSPIFDDKK